MRGLFAAVLGLGLGGIFMHFVLARLLDHWNHKPNPTDAWNPPTQQASIAAASNVNWPRLQVAPVGDLQTFRAREETDLNSYGWINRTSGTVHVPIERAMDLLVAKGMPQWGTNSDSGPSPLQLQQQRPNQSERSR